MNNALAYTMKTQKEGFTSKGKCDCCGKKGHSKDDYSKKNLTYFNCGETEHLKPLCKSKPKNNTSATSKEKRNIICRMIILSTKEHPDFEEEYQDPMTETVTDKADAISRGDINMIKKTMKKVENMES